MSDPSFSNFGESIAYHRRRQRITQRELGILIGRSRSRISDLELSRRQPNEQEVILLSKALQLDSTSLGSVLGRPRSGLPRRTVTRFAQTRLRRFVKDRPNFTRFKKARESEPKLYASLLQKLRQRQDKQLCKIYLHEIVVESEREALWELHKLAGGGRPIKVSPQRLGLRTISANTPDQHRLLTGDPPYPALEFTEPFRCVLFPQVTLGSARPCRPDNLLVVQVGRANHWLFVEINGHGHQDRQTNPLPVLTLSHQELSQPDCRAILWSKLADSLRGLAAT